MSQYPLNELKRRLQDDDISLPKRLRLAKNVVHSQHFPTVPKERVVGEWINELSLTNKITSKELKDILSWINHEDNLTNELKIKLIKVVSQYIDNVPLQNDDIQNIITFLENEKISAQLSTQIEEFLLIACCLLQHLQNVETDTSRLLTVKILNNITKYHKDSKRKLEFTVKFLDGEILETIFAFLNTNSHDTVIHLCQNILFPIMKKSFFSSFLSNLIRKDNIEELIAEKGDNIQCVIKIMSSFFTFPKGRTIKDQKFLSDFINVFVTCFKNENQLIFAFYIMAANFLNMTQNYINPAMKMPPVIFEEKDEKIKRNIFLNMLNILLSNEIDVSVRLTDTLGDKMSNVEVKKNFMSFLQAVMMGLLKLTGKIDKTTLQIIKIALQLDPSLIEQKLDAILPQIMTLKKVNCSSIETYTDTINCLLKILFKLSRGTDFISKIIPHVKSNLEALNVEQFELKQKLIECVNNGEDESKVKSKIITGSDLFPEDSIAMYGKLTSDLLFRQNKDLLITLQKELEENCLMMLEEGFVSPSIITLTEMLSAILSSFLLHNKMADHTVPLPIAEDFWSTFQQFEDECLKKFGMCVLKLNYNPPLILSFIRLCLSFTKLKLLNIKYSNTKLVLPEVNDTIDFSDVSVVLSCLKSEQWTILAGKIQDNEAILLWNQLLLTKDMAIEVLSKNSKEICQSISNTKTHIINQIPNNCEILYDSYLLKYLFTNTDGSQLKQLAKIITKIYVNNIDIDIIQCSAITNNKPLLQALVLETCKTIAKCIKSTDQLKKPLQKYINNIVSIKEVNIKEYYNSVALNNEDNLVNYVEMFKQLQLHYLDENSQLTAIFVLLIIKKCCQSKKLRRSIDNILQSIFELSSKYPDLYKLFSEDLLFDFKDTMLLELFTLNNKSTNNMLLIKCVLETAVKKVKTNSDIVKNIVDILLLHHKNIVANDSIQYFNNPIFQISCIILPLIAKEKRAITTSAFRSILANLQEKLNKTTLESFRNINFIQYNSSIETDTGTDSLVGSENLATLNAMGAYTLTLLKCCETTDAEEIKSLDCLLCGLEFFIKNAIQSIQHATSKTQHIESSLQLLNVVLRYIKKLESHNIFEDKDKLFLQIWQSIKTRLQIVFCQKKAMNSNTLDEIGICLKFLAELSSVECFMNHFVADLSNLALLKKPSVILKNEDLTKSQLASRKVSKYLWLQCLKANIIAPKCVALTKIIFRATKNVKFWIQQHYDLIQNSDQSDDRQNGNVEKVQNEDNIINIIKIDDPICQLLRNDLDILSEVILAAKKISLDYKFMDAIFELLHLIHYIMGHNSQDVRCEVKWPSFFTLFEGYFGILNNMLLSREELLEDRWPCYMQCYKTLILRLCERSVASQQFDRDVEHKLAESAHAIEKLTQSICKRKTHVSRISAYAVADICSWIEGNPPPKMLRNHLENSIALLIQASDSTYAMAFLRRALAGSIGQMTMTNMYTMYKRYHKYVGNA